MSIAHGPLYWCVLCALFVASGEAVTLAEKLSTLANSTTSILLGSSQLTGSIPTDISRFTGLKVLQLHGNVLEGTIPPQLAELTNLQDLQLQNNSLTGSIPKELGRLQKLKVLRLNNNRLSGPFPPELGELSALRLLNVSNNDITTWPLLGVLDAELFAGTSAAFCGLVQVERFKWPELKQIDVSNTGLKMSVRDFLFSLSYLPNLELLRARACGLFGDITSEWGLVQSIPHIPTGSRFLCDGEAVPRAFPTLVQLDLAGNNIGAVTQRPPIDLVEADLAGNKLRALDIAWSNLDASTKIMFLNVTGNPDFGQAVVSPAGTCPADFTTLQADPLLFKAPSANATYECTVPCRGDTVIVMDSHTLNPAALCRCRPGHGGDGIQCNLCGPNFYSNANDPYSMSRTCVACPEKASTLSSQLIKTSINDCKCPEGYFLENQQRCSWCPGGTHSGSGSTTCTQCFPGKYSQPGSSQCMTCLAGYYAQGSGNIMCTECPPGMKSESGSSSPSDCHTPARYYFLLPALAMSLALVTYLLPTAFGVCLAVRDIHVSKQNRVVISTVTSHHVLAKQLPNQLKLRIRGTGVRELEHGSDLHAAVRVHAQSLELVGAPPRFGAESSSGTIQLRFPRCMLCQGFFGLPVAFLLLVFVALATICILWLVDLWRWRDVWAPLAGLLVGTIAGLWPRFMVKSPLRHAIETYVHRRPNKPQKCERGPGRAIQSGQLVEFHDHFRSLIQRRNMYYIDHNIVRPTTIHAKLSFAEFIGAGLVDWFVSHFWGEPFQDFVESVRRHAVSQSQEFGMPWGSLRYWICTFSNNQWEIADELGDEVYQSSFYLALYSPTCNGTVMIMDEHASPLTRAWCLFETVQTKRRSDQGTGKGGFQGLFLLTSTGVLNQGNASAEIAITIARKISELRMENAQASSEADKQKIHADVHKMQGGFNAVNEYIRIEVNGALQKMKESIHSTFQDISGILKEDNNRDMYPRSGPHYLAPLMPPVAPDDLTASRSLLAPDEDTDGVLRPPFLPE